MIRPALDHDLLRKLLNRTRSDSDAEALLAIRKANEILDASGMTYDDVVFDVVHEARELGDLRRVRRQFESVVRPRGGRSR